MNSISRVTTIESLVAAHPGAVRFLLERGIACLVCGEPVWGTLEETARAAGLPEEQIDGVVDELNRRAAKGSS